MICWFICKLFFHFYFFAPSHSLGRIFSSPKFCLFCPVFVNFNFLSFFSFAHDFHYKRFVFVFWISVIFIFFNKFSLTVYISDIQYKDLDRCCDYAENNVKYLHLKHRYEQNFLNRFHSKLLLQHKCTRTRYILQLKNAFWLWKIAVFF